jgi:TIR domain
MKAFISYAHHDRAILARLHTHLAMLRRQGLSEWYDREILAGGEIDKKIGEALASSDLFLAIVSPDFLNSSYCYEREMQSALERNREGSLVIVPIIAEPCDGRNRH